MALLRGRKPSVALEATLQYALFDNPETGATLQDPERRAAFLAAFEAALDGSLHNPSRLHGVRVQGMFEALVVGLGQVRFIKLEDVGSYYFDDREGPLRLPDYRLVRNDGAQLLVEVKGVRPGDMSPQKIRTKDLDGQQRYAALMGATLKLAHYWPSLNVWTLVDASVLSRQGSSSFLTFDEAVMANEMGTIGDALIGTEPPLVFTIRPDESAKNEVTDVSNGEARVAFTIGSVDMSCNGRHLTSTLERRIALFLMLYGGWPAREEVQMDGSRLVSLDVIHAPDNGSDEATAQGFAFVGFLSSMYSLFYNWATLTETNNVAALRREADPGALAALFPADYWSHGSRDLPLWRLNIQSPNGKTSTDSP